VTGSTDSNVKVIGTMELLSGGRSIELPFHEFLTEMEVENVAGGAWTSRIKLFDDQGDRLEQFIVAAGSSRDLNFQFGWSDVNNSFQRPYIGSIMHYVPEFMPHGVVLNLEVIARSAFMQVVDRKIRSFPEGRPVSNVVRDIANERGWTAIIEDTAGEVETPWNSKGESDFRFIRDQLLPQAVNAQGSYYLCYFDEGDTFHFHSPDFAEATQHSYRIFRDISGDVLMFSPQDTQLFGALFGGGNSLYSSPVSAQGGQAQSLTTAGGGPTGSGAPALPDASAKIDLGNGIHSYNNIVARDPKEVERLTQARYAEYREHAFKATLRVHGTHRIRVSHFIDVEYTKTDGTPHYLSGNFRVFKVRHNVDIGQGWVTEFEMLRAGIGSLPGTTPLAATQTITPRPASGEGNVTITAEFG
jgi:hypothetical protein